MLRPLKMIEAFRMIGYDVFVIQGYAKERRALIRQLKNKIAAGETYDFMYSESHTEPTRLTNPNHLPTHPFMDFGFFQYVKGKGIPIGLFYCDIYWKFDSYGTELPGWKRKAALSNYRYDIEQYKKYLDRFYLPDLKICDYLKEDVLAARASELPPGAEDLVIEAKQYEGRDFSVEPLQIFYVGGLGRQYRIEAILNAVSQTPDCELTICCRKEEWEKEKDTFSEYMCDRIRIVHKSGNELEPFYEKADICSLIFENDVYRGLAKPFKAYEYLAHEKPVLSTKGTAIGRFVEENGIGWNIECDAEVIRETLKHLVGHPEELKECQKRCTEVKASNLWISRAALVAKELNRD